MIYNRYTILKRCFPMHSKIGKILRKLKNFVIRKPQKLKIIRKVLKSKLLFSKIELETINRCNGKCPFCPVNHDKDIRPFALMTEELFNKIITELGDLGFEGHLSLSSNNEPFLDKRIIQFARMARQKVPKAYIYIYTNGSVLTEDEVRTIAPYLDKMIIDNYNDTLELNSNVKKIDDLCKKNKELNEKICIHLRKQNELLFNRGGQAPNRINEKHKSLNMPCTAPFESIIIRPDGKLSLCNNDAYGKYTLGDCNINSLVEIWKSDNYQKIRTALLQGREHVEMCKYCDTV